MSIRYRLSLLNQLKTGVIELIKEFENCIVVTNNVFKQVLVKQNGYYTGFNLDSLLDIEKDFSEDIAVIKVNNTKYSYIDKRGYILGNRIYDECFSFKNGYAVYKFEDKYGFINKYGVELTEPMYDECGNFYNHKALVRKGNKYFLLTEDLKEIELDYEKVYETTTGIYRFKTKNNIGYFDSNNNIILEENQITSNFTNIKNNVGIINNKLIILSNNKITNTVELKDKCDLEIIDKYILLTYKNKYQIYDLKGNLIQESNNKFINIKEDIVKELNNKKYYFINLKTKELINEEGYEIADDFYKEKCFIMKDNKVYLLNKNKDLEETEYLNYIRNERRIVLFDGSFYTFMTNDRKVSLEKVEEHEVEFYLEFDENEDEKPLVDVKALGLFEKEYFTPLFETLYEDILEIKEKYNLFVEIDKTRLPDIANKIIEHDYMFDVHKMIDEVIEQIKNKKYCYDTINNELKELYEKDYLIEKVLERLKEEKGRLTYELNNLFTNTEIELEYDDDVDFEFIIKIIIREILLKDESDYEKNEKIYFLAYKNYIDEYLEEMNKKTKKIEGISLDEARDLTTLYDTEEIDINEDEVEEELHDMLLDIYRMELGLNGAIVGSYINEDLDSSEDYL